MDSNYNYADAFKELQQIVSEIETGEVGVDELAEKIKRASQLLRLCKAKLNASEAEVDLLLAQLQNVAAESDEDRQVPEEDEVVGAQGDEEE